MTDAGRTPHTSERAEGDPPSDDATDGRTPHPEEPAEGREAGQGEGADTPED